MSWRCRLLSLLSCAKEFIFFLISYIFLLDWVFREKDVPDRGVSNVGKCSSCQMLAVLAVNSSDLGEVCQTVFLLNSVAKESQNHRMVGVGRNLCGSSSPTLLPKQGHLQQAAEDLVQAGLEYLQRRRLHNLRVF